MRLFHDREMYAFACGSVFEGIVSGFDSRFLRVKPKA